MNTEEQRQLVFYAARGINLNIDINETKRHYENYEHSCSVIYTNDTILKKEFNPFKSSDDLILIMEKIEIPYDFVYLKGETEWVNVWTTSQDQYIDIYEKVEDGLRKRSLTNAFVRFSAEIGKLKD